MGQHHHPKLSILRMLPHPTASKKNLPLGHNRRPRIAERQQQQQQQTTITRVQTKETTCVAESTPTNAVVLPAPQPLLTAGGNEQAASRSGGGGDVAFAAALQRSKQATMSNSTTNAAWKPIPRPSELSTTTTEGDATTTTAPAAATKTKKPKKDNFVRLNLRNKAGSCRNSSRSGKSQSTRRWEERKKERAAMWKENNSNSATDKLFASSTTIAPVSAGVVDPVDDFVDGVFSSAAHKKRGGGRPKAKAKTIPVCTGHQQPCKLLTVKKTGANKGRKFYACPCPRGEQCNHFQWADDTLQVGCVVSVLAASCWWSTTKGSLLD